MADIASDILGFPDLSELIPTINLPSACAPAIKLKKIRPKTASNEKTKENRLRTKRTNCPILLPSSITEPTKKDRLFATNLCPLKKMRKGPR
jgi:hypothetical protein